MIVSWQRKRKKEKKDTGIYERLEGSFTRKFHIPDSDVNSIEANLKEGILSIIVTKNKVQEIKIK